MIEWGKRNWWWVVAIGIAGYKLALQRSQPLFAIGGTIHDDALFVKLAGHLVRGEWLGPYDQLTLAKGPAYSLFIAGNFFTGLPLTFTQGLLYAAACAIVVWSINPLLKANWAKLLGFTFLCYNPLTYEATTMSRLLRQHLTIPLGMIVAAALIALCLRRDQPRANQVGWSILGGLSLGVFWITREEGVWILPMVGLVMAALIFTGWKEGRPAFIGILTVVVVWVGCAAIPYTLVAYQNQKHYDWFGVVDMRSAEFADAMGALMRIEVGPNRAQVPVNREAREAAYLVSPAFAELRNHLEEGPIAQKWMEKQRYPFEERQFMAGWFLWALRDAIAAAGYADSAGEFLDYCERLAAEINQACEDDRLPAGPPRSGLTPRWHDSYGEGFKEAWWPFLDQAMRLTQFNTIVPFSQGTDDDIRLFVDLSWDNLSPSERATYFHKPDQIRLHNERVGKLSRLSDATRGHYEDLFYVAAIIMLLRGLELAIRRRWSWATWLAVAVFGSVVAGLTLNLMVHVMAFPNLYTAVWAPSYALMLIVVVVALADAFHAWIVPATKWCWGKWKTRRVAATTATN